MTDYRDPLEEPDESPIERNETERRERIKQIVEDIRKRLREPA